MKRSERSQERSGEREKKDQGRSERKRRPE
jgi:hypothetical protein